MYTDEDIGKTIVVDGVSLVIEKEQAQGACRGCYYEDPAVNCFRPELQGCGGLAFVEQKPTLAFQEETTFGACPGEEILSPIVAVAEPKVIRTRLDCPRCGQGIAIEIVQGEPLNEKTDL